MSYTYKYPRPAVTADCVVITHEAEPRVLLIKRGGEPFKDCWAIPGGAWRWMKPPNNVLSVN